MAIALDTSVSGGLNTFTWSHTCTGTNLILFVALFGDSSDSLTGITYAGVAMTVIGKAQVATDRWVYLYYLLGPATGANNVVVTGPALIEGQSASYTGVKQSAQPDASTTNTASSATSITTTITTVANNSWAFLVAKGLSGSTPTAGTNATRRQTANDLSIFDSNGVINPAGSFSMQASSGGSTNWAAVMASFAPSSPGASFKSSNIRPHPFSPGIAR